MVRFTCGDLEVAPKKPLSW